MSNDGSPPALKTGTDAASVPVFALSPDLDVAAAAALFARSGRVSLDPFLTGESAQSLREHLLARGDWSLVMNAGEKVFELPRAAAASLSHEQRETLDRKIGDSAAWGFQYRYESIRVSDEAAERTRSGTLLDHFGNFMRSAPVVEMLGKVIGDTVDFADAQATSYGPGHFLTRHDDHIAGKNRKAAYVLGLTPVWRAEWGGLLLFHGDGPGNEIDHGFVPGFNMLRLFAVPVQHSVSHVWPYAREPRLSVTGWARTHG